MNPTKPCLHSRSALLAWFILTGACASAAPRATAPAASSTAPAASSTAPGAPPASTAGAPVPAPAPSATASATLPEAKPCGEFNCLEFASADLAFERVLAEKPRVLAIGEAHAQKGTEGIQSTVRRFEEQLLPKVVGRATDIVIELMLGNAACKKTEQHVVQKQQPITEHQAATDQNEFVDLGTRARQLGPIPHALQPSCAELEAISNAGTNVVDRMLSTVGSLTEINLEKLLALRPPSALILAYGGALHNDVQPRPGRERWSFGPQILERTGGSYVELDLIVPEYVKDTDSWHAFPWYSAYAGVKGSHGALLYATAPHSFALIFPRSTQ